MEKKFERKNTNNNNISFGKIYKNTRTFDLESETIKEQWDSGK
jgi:hypothetical protein